MGQARSTRLHPAAIDATTAAVALVARSEISPVTTEAAWAPPGYDATDIRILEWIASHRRGRRARATASNLAA